MGRNKSKKPSETQIFNNASTAITGANAPNPHQERLNKHWTEMMDWYEGKSGPIDVTKMPGGGTDMALYNSAKQNKDVGRIGKGFQFGEGSNSNFSAQLKEETGLERDLAAAGQLENAVGNKLSGMMPGMQQAAGSLQDQRNNNAQWWSGMYGTHRQTKQPSFWEKLLFGGMGAGASIASAGMSG